MSYLGKALSTPASYLPSQVDGKYYTVHLSNYTYTNTLYVAYLY